MLAPHQSPSPSRIESSPDHPQHNHFRASHSFDTLRQVAGRSSLRHGAGRKFKVINYRDWTSAAHPSSRHNTSRLRRNPVVIFAKPGKEAGRKVVDYYYTWKGKTGTRPLKGSNRRSHFLQEEFGKELSKLTQALSQPTQDLKQPDKSTPDPSKTGTDPSSSKSTGTVSSGTAQSLPLGQDNSLSKLRIMNPDPSRSSKSGSSSSSRKSPPHRSHPSGKTDSPWSSSDTLQNPSSDSTSINLPPLCPSASCGSEGSSASSTEALIVLLDDEDDEDDHVELSRGTSWHGLERRASSRPSQASNPYQYGPQCIPCSDGGDCCSDDSCSEQDYCEPDYCASIACNPIDQCASTPVPPVYHIPSPPVASPIIAPGFVPSPMPHRAMTLPPPGFIPLDPRPMQDVIREGRSDVHGQQLLDKYAASSPYAVRPSLYFSPHPSGFVPLPYTPSSPISPIPLQYQHFHMPHQTSY